MHSISSNLHDTPRYSYTTTMNSRSSENIYVDTKFFYTSVIGADDRLSVESPSELAGKIKANWGVNPSLIDEDLDENGEISLTWRSRDDNYIFLSIDLNKFVHLYYKIRCHGKIYEWEGVGKYNNKEMLRHISKTIGIISDRAAETELGISMYITASKAPVLFYMSSDATSSKIILLPA